MSLLISTLLLQLGKPTPCEYPTGLALAAAILELGSVFLHSSLQSSLRISTKGPGGMFVVQMRTLYVSAYTIHPHVLSTVALE